MKITPVLFKDGRGVTGRKMSGEDILLNYPLASPADANQSDSGLRFGPDGPIVQRVKLYRYRWAEALPNRRGPSVLGENHLL